MKTAAAAMMLGVTVAASAQTINLWRGGEIQSDWHDPYKWKLQHVPTDEEAVHFRQPNSVIMINNSVELDNGMMLYGRNLFLEGHGHISLWSPIPHKSTVSIPASATGQANLTVSDTLTLNGRIALAAKAFGTTASSGSVTLKDQSTVSGVLQIGNDGSGTGKVFIEDQATFKISGLDLQTRAERGGSAEIHVLGGTARLTTEEDPFAVLMEDPSRRIIIGENGTLHIDSDLPVQRKSELIASLISNQRIVAAESCRLAAPVVLNDKLVLQAANKDAAKTATPLMAAIEQPEPIQPVEPPVPIQPVVPPVPQAAPAEPAQAEAVEEKVVVKRKVSLESLLQDMRTNSEPETAAEEVAVKKDDSGTVPDTRAEDRPMPLAGYIVFVSALLFCMRPQQTEK